MKKIISAVLISAILVGCGQPLTVYKDKQELNYPTVGFFNPEDKSPTICYEVSVGNVVWSIILLETIVAPVYFIGFSLFNPVPRNADGTCGLTY